MSRQEKSREPKERNWTGRIFALVMAGMIAVGGAYTYHQTTTQVAEMPAFVDQMGDGTEVVIAEGDVPLAAKPSVKTTKTTKKTTKKVKLSKAAKKTYTSKKKKTKKSTKTKTASGKKVVTDVTVDTTVSEQFKKKSKTKTVVTVVTTTTKVTETQLSTATKSSSSSSTTSKTSASTTKKKNVDIKELAPKMDSRVIRAYQKLGFTVDIDPSVSYAGYFNARNQIIILKTANDTIYHEAGHFLAFIAGNEDKKSSFEEIYKKEKGKVTCSNKAYVTQNSSEYFAESFKDYTLHPDSLKSSRPQTYAAMQKALSKVTDTQVNTYKSVYASVWK